MEGLRIKEIHQPGLGRGSERDVFQVLITRREREIELVRGGSRGRVDDDDDEDATSLVLPLVLLWYGCAIELEFGESQSKPESITAYVVASIVIASSDTTFIILGSGINTSFSSNTTPHGIPRRDERPVPVRDGRPRSLPLARLEHCKSTSFNVRSAGGRS